LTDNPIRIALCDVADVQDDTPVQATHGEQVYAVFSKDGVYYVTQDLCTHGPGNLSEGFIEDCEVECPFHQGRFNFVTGAPTAAPCTDALRTWTAYVVDGRVCIDPEEIRA
jgi:nitrite reductase/ring-hydroxylating ferredoxin subunit